MKEAAWNTVVSHELSKHNWRLSIFHTILQRANGNATSEVQHCVGLPSHTHTHLKCHSSVVKGWRTVEHIF